MDLADELRLLGDQLRSLTGEAAYYAERYGEISPYDADRYARVRSVAAELYALADTRPGEQIERELFSAVTHIAPVPTVDTAVLDDEGRLLLIRRSDDGLWALPGGALQVGETPAEGARRETLEETGVDVDIVGLAGIWDSRLCGTRAGLHLYHFVFSAQPRQTPTKDPTTPYEVLDVKWWPTTELPALSAGHSERIADVLTFQATGTPHFDRLPKAQQANSS